MKQEILDYFEDSNDSGKIVTIRYFLSEAQAELYSARLREAGIQNYIANSNTSRALPIFEPGVALRVFETDYSEAQDIVSVMDHANTQPIHEQDFREASLDEIHLLKELHEPQSDYPNWVIWSGVGLLILLFLYQVFQINS